MKQVYSKYIMNNIKKYEMNHYKETLVVDLKKLFKHLKSDHAFFQIENFYCGGYKVGETRVIFPFTTSLLSQDQKLLLQSIVEEAKGLLLEKYKQRFFDFSEI